LTATGYLNAIIPLVRRLGDEPAAGAIRAAGEAVANALSSGGKVWLTETSHCLHTEATYRAGGFMAAHILTDPVVVQQGDCVIEGTPVGVTRLAIDSALKAKARGAVLVALTNVAFENHPNTLLEHPSGRRLHELADIVVDLAGPIGDGVFEDPQSGTRIIPHSGVSGMVAMWMIFSEAVALLQARGETPRFYECVAVDGAPEKNRRERDDYLATGRGVVETPALARAMLAALAPEPGMPPHAIHGVVDSDRIDDSSRQASSAKEGVGL
jgi:uncharacterized phosphosugar-binding protein